MIVNLCVGTVSTTHCIGFSVSSPGITDNSSNKGIIFPLKKKKKKTLP